MLDLPQTHQMVCQLPVPDGAPACCSGNQGMVKKFAWLHSYRLARGHVAIASGSGERCTNFAQQRRRSR